MNHGTCKRPARLPLLVFLLLATACQLLATAPALATDNTVTVDPFYQNVRLTSGQSATVAVRLKNDSQQSRTFRANTVDFGSLDESGGLVFLGQDATELQKRYGLTRWLSLPQPEVTVAAGATVNVPVQVNNRDDLSPGGHYGAVIFSASGQAGSGQIGVNQSISALFFVSKIGGEKYGLTLKKPELSNSLLQLPANIKLSFHNTGNIHQIPRGTVEIIGPGGQVVARGIINSDSAMILPELSRSFVTPLARVERVAWPGNYTLRIQYRYEGTDKFTIVDQRFFYANAPLGLAAGLGGLVILLLLGFVARQLLRYRKAK